MKTMTQITNEQQKNQSASKSVVKKKSEEQFELKTQTSSAAVKTSARRKSTPPAGSESAPEDSEIRCRLKRIIFQAPNSPFVIGAFMDLDDKHEFTAKGIVPHAATGLDYRMQGHYVDHPKYGQQIEIDQIEQAQATNKDAVVSFLSMKMFEGIGKKTAEKIFDELGEEAISLIQEDPNILIDRCGLSEEKTEVIEEGLKTFGTETGAFMKLMKFGLSETDAARVLENYTDVETMLENDCFDPLYHIFSFPYEAALKLAEGVNMPRDDLRRLSAALYKQLSAMTFDTGSTYVTRDQLFSGYRGIPMEELQTALSYLIENGFADAESGRIYSGNLYNDEWTIARQLRKHTFPVEKINKKDLPPAITGIERKLSIAYDEHQIEAIELFLDSSVMILNGGPGTGKSTTVKGILELIHHFFPSSTVQLAAPTGKASKRLSELADQPAKTIHSLLKWDLNTNVFGVLNEGAEPLVFDFLIVDEFSMVDTHVFAGLMKALPARCRILLIGDEDQLESVGEGKVFNDLIDSKKIPIVSLTTLFRSAQGDGIAELAREIRENDEIRFGNGVEFIETESREITAIVRQIVNECDHIDSFQVLAPQYNKGAGINITNKTMQTLLNPFSPNKPYLRMRDGTDFIVGDKVILLKNLSESNVFNGDVGVITEIDPAEKKVLVQFDEEIVEFSGLTNINNNIKHAWCISVHKSQGSEYQEVCVIADPLHQFMLTKKLIYTAISRAKKKLTIVGSKDAFIRGCRTPNRYERQTTLKERMQSVFRN